MKRFAQAAVAVALIWACGSNHVRRAAEDVEVVGGTPSVGQNLPGVERQDGGLDGSVYGPAAPFQVDSFDQQQIQKVDILWVIDNSPSMAQKQNRLKANISDFMNFLAEQKVDYHLGVVSTDTFAPAQSGRLQNLPPGGGSALPVPWVSPDAGAAAAGYFISNATLGEGGSADEKGLLGGMMALTPPLSPAPSSANPDAGAFNCARLVSGVECFLRPDAALYTVMLSDEEDSSCTPVDSSGGIMNGEGCTDANIRAAGGYGLIDYWSRFYTGIKGLGSTSRMAAIVATDSSTHDCGTEFAGFCDAYIGSSCSGNTFDCNNGANAGKACCTALINCNGFLGGPTDSLFYRAQRCHVRPAPSTGPTTGYTITGQWQGCKSLGTDGGVEFTAIYANRYASVAQATGGIATSICDQTYLPALSKLGLQASGLRSDFPLSRAPIDGTIIVQEQTAPDAGVVIIPEGPTTWSYVRCDGSTPTNVVRFTDTARPPAGAKISVSYDVNVRGLGTCP